MRIIVTLAILLFTRTAAADDDAAIAAEHAKRARANAIAGHIDDAIREFDLALRSDPLPKYAYNKAQLKRRRAETNADRIEDMRGAVDDYMRYLSLDPKAPDRHEIEGYIAELRAMIESAEAARRDTKVAPAEPPAKAVASEEDPKIARARSLVGVVGAEQPPPKRSRKGTWIAVGVVAGVVVAGTAIGLGVGLSQGVEIPHSTLGNQVFQ